MVCVYIYGYSSATIIIIMIQYFNETRRHFILNLLLVDVQQSVTVRVSDTAKHHKFPKCLATSESSLTIASGVIQVSHKVNAYR